MIDIKTIKCPQCGAPSHNNAGNNTYKCDMCGSTYVVGSYGLPQTEGEGLYVANVVTAYSHNDFVKGALTAIAEEDSPLDVFDCTEGQVREIDHQVYINSGTADVAYTASIGYDSKEPYTATEKYYDKQLKKMRERQVTKYKKVTTWQSLSNNQSVATGTIVELGQNQLDSSLFADNLYNCGEPDTTAVADAGAYHIPADVAQDAENKNHYNMQDDIKSSLPGDHVKDYHYDITNYNSHESLWLAKEYEVDITYKGNSYTKRAFPFGNMTVGGDSISGGTVETDSIVLGKTKLLHIATTVMLALSILISVLALSTTAILVVFIVAMAMNMATRIVTYKAQTDVQFNYKQTKRKLLQAKLTSLGIDTATDNKEAL